MFWTISLQHYVERGLIISLETKWLMKAFSGAPAVGAIPLDARTRLQMFVNASFPPSQNETLQGTEYNGVSNNGIVI